MNLAVRKTTQRIWSWIPRKGSACVRGCSRVELRPAAPPLVSNRRLQWRGFRSLLRTRFTPCQRLVYSLLNVRQVSITHCLPRFNVVKHGRGTSTSAILLLQFVSPGLWRWLDTICIRLPLAGTDADTRILRCVSAWGQPLRPGLWCCFRGATLTGTGNHKPNGKLCTTDDLLLRAPTMRITSHAHAYRPAELQGTWRPSSRR
jgi:hypothetical protein